MVSPRKIRDASLLVVCLAIFGLGIWSLLPARQPPVTLKLSAGSHLGTRHVLALQLKDICRAQGIELKVIPTDGSEHALQELVEGHMDLALVQGGIVGQHYPHVTQVAPLHLEPLHLLAKPELAALIRSEGLAALGGRVINTGSPGSGTHSLATLVLKFLGLRLAPGDVTTGSKNGAWPSHYLDSQLSYDQMLAATDADQLPDAVFSISSLPSTFAKELIERHEFELVELPFSDAFALDAFDYTMVGEDQPVPKADKRFDQSRVFPITIPAFTYSVRRQQPPKPLATIGTRLLLVASDRVPKVVVERLLQVVFDSSLTKNARPPVEISVLDSAPEFPWHAGAISFIAHHRPLIAGAFVELTANGLAIVGSVLGGTFFLLQWLRNRRKNANETEFRRYVTSVLEVEKELLEFDSQASVHVGRLVKLHEKLIALKREVAHRFFSGELDGHALMLGFMNLANDVRNQISRLILHERDNVEEQAHELHQDLESLWHDRIQELE